MYSFRLILSYQLLMLAIFGTNTVKIGISKSIPITSTLPPTTTIKTLNEDVSIEGDVSEITESLIVTMKTTIVSDTEWPEFPPKIPSKTSNKTTTEKPLMTTAITPNVTANETSVAHDPETFTTSFPKWPIKQKYCFCDLIKDDCDINCCCDRDCSMEALKVFRCQFEKIPIDLELQEGRFDDFKFQHGLPSCEVNDGWLCVFRTNKPVAKKEGTYYLMDTSRHYKWPNLLLESEDVKTREFYKFGDLMRIININTKEIQNFDLPSSFESTYCQIREPIYYLKPSKKSCLISSYENLKEVQIRLLQLEDNYKILNTPLIPDDIYNVKHLENFVGNITIYECQKNKNNCSHYQKKKETDEHYAIFEAKVNILHNFTHIQQVVVDLWFEDLKREKLLEKFAQDYWLSYETEFFNQTLKDFRATHNQASYKHPTASGPLGYSPGKPLFVARYEPFNKSQPLSTTNQVLNYFSVNNTESHALSLLDKANGLCKRLKQAREFISYGINVAYYCKIKLENDSVIDEEPLSTNFTEICLNLQQRINDQLFGQDLVVEDISSYFISQLGKPQNISSKWMQLQVYNTDFDSVVGQYLHETKTFVCRNILLSLSYEFHMDTYVVDNIPMQNVISRAVLHLAERHDLEFSLNENLEVPVTMTVRFYDVREKVASAGYDLLNINLSFCLIFCLIILFTSNNHFIEM